MKGKLFAVALVLISFLGISLPQQAPAQVYNWTGFYVGLNAGGSFGDSSVRYPLGNARIGLDPNSFIGGGHAGYNLQNDFIVIGLEADIAWRHGTDKNSFGFPGGIDFARHAVEQNWVGTVRPRFGFAFNQFLLYGTAGLAYGNLEHRFTETRPGVATRSKSKSGVEAGWTVGGGLEYGVSSKLTAGLEYLYMSFGDSKLGFPVQTINGLAFPTSSATFGDISHVVRAKIAYKF